MASQCQVRVGVRIRPVTSQEIKQGGKEVLNVTAPSIGIGERCFTYDAVFGSHIGQQELYDHISKPLLGSFVDGYNATIMAYGQTGSGKTFTMGSEAHSEPESLSHAGLIPRFLADIFSQLQQMKEAAKHHELGQGLVKFKVSASFLEVYGEDVHDLLDRDRRPLPLREDSNGGIVIVGLTNRPVTNATEALEVLHEGTMNRTTAATLMNLTSSRSHAVFTIHLSQTTRSGNEGDVDVTTNSRFTFVDLAGSERMKKTGAEGERAKEGIKINEGLLALGNVINALADEELLSKEKKVHVPYRQSKLTRLLQDALGGNSQTLFLACVSPSDTNASETLSTLHYANRARNIKNAPTKNIDANVLELQRLQSLTRIFQCELVKSKFGQEGAIADEKSKIGEIDSEIMKRSEVMEYIQTLHNIASDCQQPSQSLSSPSRAFPPIHKNPGISNMEFQVCTPGRQFSGPKSGDLADSTPNKLILDRFEDHLLDEVNPDAEMAILDQLLEIQQKDHQFGQEQKKDTEQLKIVEGELAEQEAMLLQLRESLRVYHNMKDKYEALMAEVQQLETEKEQLADQLEKAKADPSKGCSASITRKLEKVEQNLSRARSETRKHRQMCRKAEQEAQRCKALERKIAELNRGRVALIKKQKEAAAKHREYTDSKTREIAALKRKERNTEKRVSKLQSEIQIHKTNLEKRKQYCGNLAQKLQKTESHLMKLLAMRNKEFRDRRSTVVSSSRRRSIILQPNNVEENEQSENFAPENEEIKSIGFLLDRAVCEKVNQSEMAMKYEERVTEYSEMMRKLVTDIKNLEEAKKCALESNSGDNADLVWEYEQNVEELELRIELLGSELDELRSKLSFVDGHVAGVDETSSTVKILSGKSAPLLRTLLLSVVEKYSETELERRRFASAIQRKDFALESLENEVENLNSKIAGLTSDLTKRRRLTGENKVEMIQILEEQMTRLKRQLQEAEEKLDQANYELSDLKATNEKLAGDYSMVKEDLTLAQMIVRQNDGVHPSESFLEKTQGIWDLLGVDSEHRESIRLQIESCLEDTCSRKLKEQEALKEETSSAIEQAKAKLRAMQAVLGISTDTEREPSDMKLLNYLSWLKREEEHLRPSFNSAMERREKIIKDTTALVSSMKLTHSALSRDLQTLLQTDSDGPEKITKNLSNVFLSKCEEEISSLRLKKARILVRNTEVKSEVYKLVQEMNLCEDDVADLTLHSIRQRQRDVPQWWEKSCMEQVARCVAQSNGVINAGQPFSNHLEIVFESLDSVANGRRKLSSVLSDIVKRAQKTLLDTVDGEVDASEAYASFHDVLFRLPPLSKEFVEACVTEIDALVLGVETMAQSEIEALTVVWEALNVSATVRGKFWSEIDESTKAIESSAKSPFDDVLRTNVCDKEQWVLTAVKESRTSYKKLETRLLRLERIHQEVEKRRASQDSKSRIISLDSELRILSARLADFEEKKCNKQRLLTKKSGSSALLKEERFRKQMQGKYASTLEQLATLLQQWEEEEGSPFDPNLLSDDVRSLLADSNHTENWVEKRTEFMHLRTTKSAVKRKPERPRPISPPRKRHIKPSNIPRHDTGDCAIGKKRDARTTMSPFKPKPLESTNASKKRKADKSDNSLQTSTSTPKRRLLGNKRESTTLMPFGRVLTEEPVSYEKENSPKR